MSTKQRLTNAFIAVCVVVGLFAAVFGSAVSSSAAEPPELPLAELLYNQGITKLEVGKTYPVVGDLTVTLEYARNGKGTQIDVKIVKRTGHLKSDPNQTYTGYFFEHLARTTGAVAPAVISETEDVRMGLRFNKQIKNSRDGTFDDDPKNNNQEQGARFKVNGVWYEMDHSASNVDSEVAFVQVDQMTDLVEFESDDSWHAIVFIRVSTTTISTPTPTSTPTVTATPSVTATPVIPPPTGVYTLYLSLIANQPYTPPPTATPTPLNDCKVLDAPGQMVREVNGVRIIKPARGAQVLLQALSLTGDNVLLTLWEKGQQISANNEFSFRANPGTRNFEARFNGQPALQPCTIRVEFSSGDSNPTPTSVPPTPEQPTATQPPLPTPPPEPTQPPAIVQQ